MVETSGNDIVVKLWEALARHVLIVFGREARTERAGPELVEQHAHLRDRGTCQLCSARSSRTSCACGLARPAEIPLRVALLAPDIVDAILRAERNSR
jgi:hypothetical protein